MSMKKRVPYILIREKHETKWRVRLRTPHLHFNTRKTRNKMAVLGYGHHTFL